MNAKMKFTRTLILVVGVCTMLANTGFARHRHPSAEPDGNRGNENTSEGLNALRSLTNGTHNTAMGTNSLFNLTTANDNTAIGADALLNNNADSNTAVGSSAL